MQAVLTRHAARVKATKERIELKLIRLSTKKLAIEAKLVPPLLIEAYSKRRERLMTT